MTRPKAEWRVFLPPPLNVPLLVPVVWTWNEFNLAVPTKPCTCPSRDVVGSKTVTLVAFSLLGFFCFVLAWSSGFNFQAGLEIEILFDLVVCEVTRLKQGQNIFLSTMDAISLLLIRLSLRRGVARSRHGTLCRGLNTL
jgi:hypothetical protein